jgi:hypothetical protein
MATGAHPAGESGERREGATTEMPPVGGAPTSGQSPADAHAAAGHDAFAARPEAYVGAAFAGGLILAKLIGRLRR